MTAKTYEPRCADHKDRKTLPRLCHTCQRIAAEREIVTMTVDALLKIGMKLNTDYGDGPMLKEPTADRTTILGALFLGDEDRLYVHHPMAEGWIYFVYGNSGYDVISDYTINLENELKDVFAFCKEME